MLFLNLFTKRGFENLFKFLDVFHRSKSSEKWVRNRDSFYFGKLEAKLYFKIVIDIANISSWLFDFPENWNPNTAQSTHKNWFILFQFWLLSLIHQSICIYLIVLKVIVFKIIMKNHNYCNVFRMQNIIL